MTRAILWLVVAVVYVRPLDAFLGFNTSGLSSILNPLNVLKSKIDLTKDLASTILNGLNISTPIHTLFSSGKASSSEFSKWPEQQITFTHPRQSPIDLLTTKAVTKALPSLHIVKTNLDGVSAKLYNSGHSLYVYFNEDASLRPHLVGGPLNGKFIFEQMHFHWGSADDWGSEHFVDGESYAVEMHMVHWNSKYATFDEASTKADGLAVLTVFAEAHTEDNPLLTPLHSLLSNVTEAKSYVMLDSIKAMQWAASALKSNTEYYCYPGSLTTSPYSENVVFIIMPSPISLSITQLRGFRSLHSSEHGNIEDNKRQLQPLHNRPIVRSTHIN